MTPNAQSPSGGRLAAIIAGGIIASIATMLLLAGSGLLWLNDKKDADGYFTTDTERFATSTYAIASEGLDIDDDIPFGDDSYGKVRLKVRSDDGAPVFVGIARSNDVDAYLGASAHATLTDVEFSPFDTTYNATGGERRPAAPGTQAIWAASAEGSGTQTMTWDVKDGSWSVVVMNADGSPGVSAGISAGANIPLVGDVAWAVTIAGFVLLAGGGGLMAGGLIRPRRRPSPLAGSASAA